jgi:hypothetical protein
MRLGSIAFDRCAIVAFGDDLRIPILALSRGCQRGCARQLIPRRRVHCVTPLEQNANNRSNDDQRPAMKLAAARSLPPLVSRARGYNAGPDEVPAFTAVGETGHAAVGCAPEYPARARVPGREEHIAAFGQQNLRRTPVALHHQVILVAADGLAGRRTQPVQALVLRKARIRELASGRIPGHSKYLRRH